MCTTYEDLITEYDGKINIEERDMANAGLYCDGNIWINRRMTSREKKCILAEEIGHYETTVGDITRQEGVGDEKQELRARQWGYRKIVPLDEIKKAAREGYNTPHELAEYLDVDECFLVDALNYYKTRRMR